MFYFKICFFICILSSTFAGDIDIEFSDSVSELMIVETPLETGGYSYSKDQILIAKIIHHESCHELYEGKVAIGNLIFNRLRNPKFPKSIKAIIYQKNQFSCIYDKITPCDECKRAAVNSETLHIVPENCLFYWSSYDNDFKHLSRLIPIDTVGNHIFCNIKQN